MFQRFPFTRRALEAISPNDPESKSLETEYCDVECIGLKPRVRKGGRTFFQHSYRYMGRKKCLTIGNSPHFTIQDARSNVSERKSLLTRFEEWFYFKRGVVRKPVSCCSKKNTLPTQKSH